MIASAKASTSPGGTSTIPSPAAAISCGPGSPRQPMTGTPAAIASTYATPKASSIDGMTNRCA